MAPQTLVFGRMLQMQQNQTSPGGFMGVYTQDWSDEQNRYWYQDNTPVSPQDFRRLTPTRRAARLGVRRAEQSALCF